MSFLVFLLWLWSWWKTSVGFGQKKEKYLSLISSNINLVLTGGIASTFPKGSKTCLCLLHLSQEEKVHCYCNFRMIPNLRWTALRCLVPSLHRFAKTLQRNFHLLCVFFIAFSPTDGPVHILLGVLLELYSSLAPPYREHLPQNMKCLSLLIGIFFLLGNQHKESLLFHLFFPLFWSPTRVVCLKLI